MNKLKTFLISTLLVMGATAIVVPTSISLTKANNKTNTNTSSDAHPYGNSDVKVDYTSISDGPIPSERPYDDSKKYNYSSFSFTNKYGSFIGDISTGYTSTSAFSLAVNNDTINTPFPYGSFETSITGTTNTTDDGLIFGLSDGNQSTYWEKEGVNYYFYFLGQNGRLALGKIVGNTYTGVYDISVGSFSPSTTYKLKVILKSNLMYFYLNDVFQFYFKDENFLEGQKFGIRSAGKNVVYEGIRVTSEYEYGL